MNNNDISKFNGQYLKCIVTKHKGTMNALSDKGALIVYQNNNRNYAYLGNEFIASGYGFDSLEQLNNIEKIINSYDDNIETINNSLENINNEIEEINSNLNKNISNIFNKYEPYVTVYYGDNKVSYKLNDIFFRGQLATYEDIEFTEIRKYVVINNGTNDSAIKVIGNDPIDLIIGTKINKIIYEFDYNKNDTAGFQNLYINYFKSYEDYNAYVNGQKDKISQIGYRENQIQSSTSVGTFVITFNFDKEPFYVTGSDPITIVDHISGDIYGTSESQYKYYPRFKTYDLLSTENIIDDHYHIFNDKLCVRPITFLRYRFNEFNITENGEYIDDDNRINELDLSYICNNIMINSTDNTGKFNPNYGGNRIVVNNEEKDVQSIESIYKTTKGNIFFITIPVENINLNVFTFFIPYSFKVHKLIYVTEYSEYNLTGALGFIENIFSNNTDMPIYIKGPLANYQENKFYYLKSRIYQMTMGKGHFSKPGFFKLELICLNENFENDIDFNETLENGNRKLVNYSSYLYFSNTVGNIYQISKCTKWTILNDEEFNKIYWISFNDIPNNHEEAINALKNKLEFIDEKIIE